MFWKVKEFIKSKYTKMDLDLEWTRIKSLGRLKKVGWKLNLHNVESKDLLELENDLGLDLRWLPLELQIKVKRRIREWKLEVLWEIYYDDIIEKIYNEKEDLLDFKYIEGRYWKNVEKIESEQIRKWLIRILKWEYEYWKKYYAKKIKEIVLNKNITEEKKKKEIEKINKKWLEKKRRIEWFNVKF